MRRIASFLALTLSLGCPSSSSDGGGSSGAVVSSSSGATTGTPTAVTPASDSTTSTPTVDTSTGAVDSTGEPATTGASDSTGSCPLGTRGCPCDDGACDGALQCRNDTCLRSTSCDPDASEPNDEEENATDLGEISDADGDGDTISGSLYSLDDVDWYRYDGDDDFGSLVDPVRTLKASGGARMCKFFECADGLAKTEFDCPPGADYALSTMARPGCCSDSGDIILPEFNCAGAIEDSASVYIRIDQPESACVTYDLSYHY